MDFIIVIDKDGNKVSCKTNSEKYYKEVNINRVWKFTDKNLGTLNNIITVDLLRNKLEIESDRLGQYPVYFGVFKSTTCISNNMWHVVSCLKKLGMIVFPNKSSFDDLYNYTRILSKDETVVNNILKLPPSSIYKFDLNNGICVKSVGIDPLIQKEDKNLSLDDVVDQLHHEIASSISSLSNQLDGREVVFGNSGGLDSRIIPGYLKKIPISFRGYVVTDRSSFNNNTKASSDMVGKYYDFETRHLYFDQDNGWNRLLRDIFVNPLGPANFYKNPQYQGFSNKIILTGGNSFIVTNDTNSWKEICKSKNSFRVIAEKYMIYNNSVQNLDKCESYLRKRFDYGLDPFSLIRTFHAWHYNVHSPMGGFESMSNSGEFYYLYNSAVLKKSLNWPKDYFYDRKLQSMLLEKYFGFLSNIPDQTGLTMKQVKHKKYQYYFKKIINRVLQNGMTYSSIVGSEWEKLLLNEVNIHLKLDLLEMQSKVENITEFKLGGYGDKFNMIKVSAMFEIIKLGKFDLLFEGEEDYGKVYF
jgi:hypothetical protein